MIMMAQRQAQKHGQRLSKSRDQIQNNTLSISISYGFAWCKSITLSGTPSRCMPTAIQNGQTPNYKMYEHMCTMQQGDVRIPFATYGGRERPDNITFSL